MSGKSIVQLSREYLRATDELEAKQESFLADVAREYYAPGYLTDSEWELVKDSMKTGEMDDVMTVVEVAVYRKASQENERWDMIADAPGDWPAKPSHL